MRAARGMPSCCSHEWQFGLRGWGVETPLAFTEPRHLPGASLPAGTLPPPQLRVGRWLSEQPALWLPSAPFPPPVVVATFPASRSVCLRQRTPGGSCCFTPARETGLWRSAEGRTRKVGGGTLPVGEKPSPLQLPTGARPRPRRPHLERTPCSAPRAGRRCCGAGLAGPALGWTPRWVMQSLQCLGYGRNALVSCARSGVLFLVTTTPPPNIPKRLYLGTLRHCKAEEKQCPLLHPDKQNYSGGIRGNSKWGIFVEIWERFSPKENFRCRPDDSFLPGPSYS